MRYWVAGKQFRYLCDASEWSFQLCRKWIDSQGLPKKPSKYHINRAEEGSYYVWDVEGKHSPYSPYFELREVTV